MSFNLIGVAENRYQAFFVDTNPPKAGF